MDKPPYQEDETDQPDEDEEEEEKDIKEFLDSRERTTERPENLSETDDNILLEFKKKYQKSLEAIQSFQEILELKKNYTVINHSYNPLRKKESQSQSFSASKPRFVPNTDPLKPRLEPIYHVSIDKVHKIPQKLAMSPQTDPNRSQKNFKIRDVSFRGSGSSFHSPTDASGNLLSQKVSDTKEGKDMSGQLGVQSPQTPKSTTSLKNKLLGRNPLFSTPQAKQVKQVEFNSEDSKKQLKSMTTSEQIDESLQGEIGLAEPLQMDEVMGEPFVKIKIKNLGNFRAEPLEDYDEALMFKEEDPAGMLNAGMDQGYSKYLGKNGETEWKTCEILEYLEDEKKFLIRWKHDGTLKKVTRLNLRYAYEHETMFDERLKKAVLNRYKNLYMGSYKGMLKEKAKGDIRLNFPMKSLNEIIKLAFGRLENIEDSELPLRLIDQLMDHYKQEIVRFSLEIRSYQSDLSTYVKKFTGAYRILKNVPIVNQERALEIVNMPYKEYKNYQDLADNVIVDSEEMDRAELPTFNDPNSQKMFYKSMSRNSKMKYTQSPDTLVKAYGSVDFANFLTMDETKLTSDSHREKARSPEEEVLIKKELDPKGYKSRAVLKRKIRLVDINRIKAEYKLLKPHKKMEDNMSYLVTAFKQTFNKILPKPLDFTGQFLTMVSALFRQLSEIKLFRGLRMFKNNNVIRNLDVLPSLREDFNTDANKIELYIYRVQQCVDELKTDIKVLKNEVHEKETLRRVCDFCTTMAHDAIKICIKESLEDLINNLEEYYGLLPLPNISKEIYQILPPHISKKRADARKVLSLSPDKFYDDSLTEHDKEAAPESSRTAKGDKDLMQAIILCLMNDIIKEGNLFKEDFIEFEALRLKPLFWIKYVIKGGKNNTQKKPKIKMSRQDRARHRLNSRENIYQFDEFKDRLLADHFRGDEIPETVKEEEVNEKYVGKSSFNWFKLGKGITTHEPHIYDIEERLKKLIASVFEVFPKLEKIDVAALPNANFVTIEGLQDELLNFRFRLDELFKISLIPVLAVFSILNNFEFLLTQEKHYVSDVKEAFNDSTDKNIGIICKEIKELETDLDFVSTRLPKTFNLGFFLLDISEFLEKLKKNIETYLEDLKEYLQQKLNEILTSSRATVDKIEERLRKGAAVIDDYIELKIFLDSEQLKSDMESIKEGVELSEQITTYIEIFSIDYNPDVLDTFYMSKGWINRLSQAKRNAQVQLEASRPRLIHELRQKNEEIFRELEGIKIEISNYSNYYDVNNAATYFTNARIIDTRLDELVKYGQKCNFYEEMLVAKKTDFAGFGVVRENFSKFFLLWDFIYEKWMIKSDFWLNSPFESIDMQEMEDLILEGLNLLNVLEEKFRHNINILELVRTYLREVHRFKDYLELLKKLKSETFKPRHWEMLWNEMYASITIKPDPKTVSLKKLLEDKLFSYASLIHTIHKNAQDEYNIEQEIEKIEENLTKIKDLKVDTYDVGHQSSIFILKGISHVLSKLNDHHFVIKNMLANPNYPRTFLDKLNNLEYVIRGTKKVLRLIDKIQKKLFIICPIMRHRFIAQYFGKDYDYGTVYSSIQTQFKQQIEGVVKRKMAYIVALFDKTVTAAASEASETKHEANGEDVIENLQKIIVKCDTIISNLYIVLKQARHTCPRLHILTDSHIIQYLSVVAEPVEVIKDLGWVFTAVRELKIEMTPKQPVMITGVVNNSHESLSFVSKVVLNPQEQDGSNFFLCTLLNDIEKEIKRAIKDNLVKASPSFFQNAYNYRNNFRLVKDKTLLFQILVLLNNILFYHDLTMIIASKEYASENIKETFVNTRLNMFKSNIEHNLAFLTETLPYEKEKYAYLLLNQFIFYIKHQIDILNYVMEADVQSLDSFEYLVLPKAMFEYNTKAIRSQIFMDNSVIASRAYIETMASIQDYNSLNAQSEYLNLYKIAEPSNYNVIFRSFNYKKNYGFDLVPFAEPTVLTPSTNRSYVTMLGALCTQTGVLVNGLQDRGKKETIRGLAYMLGKEIFTVDQYSANYEFLTQLIFGVVKGSFWVVFDNIQEYSHAVLSTMAQQIHMVRSALASGETRIKYGSLIYDLRGEQNWGLFATYSLTQKEQAKSLDRIPKNFLENFRILNYVYPHLSHIVSLYFELYGVQNPLQAANRVITFFQVLSNATENQIFFLSENLTLEDVELLQSLNITPSMSLIRKMIRNIQQMLINQTVLKIDIPEIWKAIKECILSVVKERVMKLVLHLFNTIFQTDINEAKDPPNKDTEFKEMLDEYNAENHSGGSVEFDKKCEQLYKAMKSHSSRYKTILISGRPGRGKTSMIEAVAKIRSKLLKKNFCLNWIDLDSTPSVLILGGKYENNRLQGLIPILIDVAVNNMSQVELQENEYSSLISHCSRWANPKIEAEIPQDHAYDWVVLEGAYDELHSETIDLVERLLAGRRQSMITALDGLKIRIPKTMSFIIECDKMNALNPANLADVALVNLEENLFSLRQEFVRKTSYLTKFSDFFITIQPLLNELFDNVIEPVVQKAQQDFPKNLLLYYLSSNYIFLNFMNVFEMLLNECRKMEISFGNISDNEIERSEAHYDVKKSINPQEEKKLQKLLVVSRGDIMGIRHSMKLEPVPAAYQVIDRQTIMVESTCIFAIIWTIGTLYRPEGRSGFSKFLLEKLANYYKDSPLKTMNPPHPAYFLQFFRVKLDAKGLSSPGSGFTIFDYCLDTQTQSWVLWKNLSVPDYQEISSDFSGIRLPTKEVAKFNPLLKKSTHTKSFADPGFIRTHIPTTNDQIFVQTDASKKLMFFLDYLIAYKKPVIVLSEYENGKTVIINQKLRLLLEHNSYKTFTFSLTPFTTKEQLSKHIQTSLVKNFKGGYSTASDMEGLIFIDDLNLSSIEHRPWSLLKSFYSYKGWYNVVKGSFIKLDRVSFLAASSHSFLKTQNVFHESLSNLPQAFLHKMLLFSMPEMTSQDLKAIFREYTEPIFTEAEGKVYLKSLKHYFNQFLIFNFRNKQHLKSLSHIFGCNFTLTNALQLFKTLHLWDWTDQMNVQNVTDLWFFCLKRIYASQFGKVETLPEEFMLDLAETELSRSMTSSRMSPTTDLDGKGLEDRGDIGDSEDKAHKKFSLDDSAKPTRPDRKAKSYNFSAKERNETRDSADIIKEKLRNYQDPNSLGKIEEDSEHEGAYSRAQLKEEEPEENEEEKEKEETPKVVRNRKDLRVIINNKPSIIGEEGSEESEQKSQEEAEQTVDKLSLSLVQGQGGEETRAGNQEGDEEQDENYNFKVRGTNSSRRSKAHPSIKIAIVDLSSTEEKIMGETAGEEDNQEDEEGSIENKSLPPKLTKIPLRDSLQEDADSSKKDSLNASNQRPPPKKQSQFSSFANRKGTEVSALDGAAPSQIRSSIARASIDQGVPTETEGDSGESEVSIATSASDEELNALEKHLDMDANEELAKFPSESMNILSRILMFSNPPSHKMRPEYKVTDGVVQDGSFAFNTELLTVERHELNSEGFTPIFQLINSRDEDKKREIMQHIQAQMKDHLPDNKPALFFFNNFTFRLSTLLPHLSSLLLELQTPNQHFFLTSMSQPVYCYHALKFSSHILAYRVATFNLTPKKASNSDIHSHFINLFHDTVSISAHENRKCVFAIFLDGFRPGGIDISQQTFSSIIKILQDLNAIILGASLKSILPRHQLKTLMTVLKKSETYGHFPESHLLYILTQIVTTNIKFVIIAEEQALQLSDLKFRFEKHPEKLTLVEIFLKYFPHCYMKFRKVILNDLQLSVDKKLIFSEDIFPLNLDEELCLIFQNSFNFEVQYGSIQENEAGYSVIPNYRVAIILADFVYTELLANLTSKAEAQKSTGHSLVGAIKKLKKKAEIIDNEVKDLRNFIEERKQEIEHIDEAIRGLQTRKEELSGEMGEINKQLETLDEDLKGFEGEESTLKKLQGALTEVTNAILTYNGKEYTEDIKFAKFFSSKFFTLYALLWCYIFNIKVEEENFTAETDVANLNLGDLTPEFATACTKEFGKALNDYGQLKNKIISFKVYNVTRENLARMIDIIKDNNLATGNVRFNKLQKNIMKWMDLVVETSKFELRKDFRIKEIKSIKAFSEQLLQELAERKQVLDQIEVALIEQPKLQAQVTEKIESTEQNIQNMEATARKMIKLAKHLEIIIKANFEVNNPVAANKALYGEYIRATALYMVQCVKYSAKIRSYLFKLLLNNMSPELNFNIHKIHHVLYGEAFLIDCLRRNVPVNLNFIDNLAVFDMILELNLHFPLVIDPSGLFLKFMKQKFAKALVVEYFCPETITISNIISALESGCILAIVDFNKDLLNIIEPILTWRYNQIINRVYNKHYYSTKKEDREHDDQDPEVVVVNQVQDQIEFNGTKFRVHPDFKLVLILQNNFPHISKGLLEKVFVINNDINSESTWCETVSDILLTTCYRKEREEAINQYYNEKLFNEANEQFNVLSEKLKKVDFLGVIDPNTLDQIIILAESVREKYRAQSLSTQQTLNDVQPPELIAGISKTSIYLGKPSSPIKVTREHLDLQEGEKKLELSFSSLQKNTEGKKGLTRQGSVKTSFYHHSQSIATSPRSSGLKKKFTVSLFLEGMRVEEYSNLFNSFPGLDYIIKRHQRLLNSLYLLRTSTQILNKGLGSAYSFSEYHILFNVFQALEIAILNGYLKNTGKPEDAQKFDTVVTFNAFHQLYAMFRKDHQNIFSFCYALLKQKLTKDFPEPVWKFFIYKKVALSSTQKMLLDPNTDKAWENLVKYLIDYFHICDNRVPPIVLFHPDTHDPQNTQKLLARITEEGSVFDRFMRRISNVHNISLNIPPRDKPGSSKVSGLTSNNTSDASIKDLPSPDEKSPIAVRKNKKALTVANVGNRSSESGVFKFEDTLQGLDIPKIANTAATKEDKSKAYLNINFHSDMADMLAKSPNNSKHPGQPIPGVNPALLQIADSPKIHQQAYQMSFSESFEQSSKDKEEIRASSQGYVHPEGKMSRFARQMTEVPTVSAGLKKQSTLKFEDKKSDSPDEASARSAILDKESPSPSPTRFTLRSLLDHNRELSNKDDDVIVENYLLTSLKEYIPSLGGMIFDMEKDIRRWTEFLNKSMLKFRNNHHIFPQMPNNWTAQFNSIEILAIMKCLRPDALETIVQGFLGETKHRSYYMIPRTNFESHARTNWYKRPTLVFFGNEYKNPTESIELLANRNRNQCFKTSLGETPLEIVFEEFSKYSTSGKWFVIENLHLLEADKLATFIKKINSDLENENTHNLFKLWMTYYQEGQAYCDFDVPPTKRPVLEPFFRTCFKTYVNVSDSIKSRIMEFYKGNMLDFYGQLEQGMEDFDTPANSDNAVNNKTPTLVPFQKVRQHRLKLQQIEERVDLYELFQHKLASSKKELDLVKQTEMQNQNAKVRFTTSFLFSIIRERFKYEKSLPANYFKNYIIHVSDNDLVGLLDDILDFVEKNALSPFTAVEKFFSFMFNYKTSSFMTFNNVNIQYLFRNFVGNNQTFRPVQVKDATYNMLSASVVSEAEIFQCIKSFPNEDPVQLFGYNVNHEILHSYKKSKSMFNFLLKCNDNINDKEMADSECNELEKLILNQKHEKELEVILEEYMSIKNDQSTIHIEQGMRLVSLLKKLLEFIPSSFNIKTISYFGVYQPMSSTSHKHPFFKGDNLSHKSHLSVDRPTLTITPYDEDEAPANLKGKRRPSLENAKDKIISDTIRSTYAQKVSQTGISDRRGRKYSFTVLESPILPVNKLPIVTKSQGSARKSRPSSKLEASPQNERAKTPVSGHSSFRSHQGKSEDKNMDQSMIGNKVIFKNLILNEIKLCNKIILKMRNDLEYALRVIQGSEIVENVHPAHAVVMALMKNELPESWYNLGSLPIAHSQSLITFLKILNIKYQNLKALVHDRECLMYPIIPLPKLFDPFFLFVSIIWNHCTKNQIPFNECELVLQNVQTRPLTQQNDIGGVYLNGFKISGGRITKKYHLLEEEYSREFTSNLGNFIAKVRRRPKMTYLLDEDPSIPVIIKPKISESKRETGDIVNDYHEYMKKYMLNRVQKGSKEAYNPVRIPFVDPCSRLFKNYFHLELFLYVRSSKPQEYWQMKGTCVLLQIDT